MPFRKRFLHVYKKLHLLRVQKYITVKAPACGTGSPVPRLQLVSAFLVRARSFSGFFFAIFFLIYFAFACLFCCRLFQEVSGWSRCLEICVAQACLSNLFSQMVAAIVLEKVTFSGMRSNSEN